MAEQIAGNLRHKSLDKASELPLGAGNLGKEFLELCIYNRKRDL